MANKADVKAIMARFQATGSSVDDSSSTPAGRAKQPLHPTLSSGPNIQPKKPVLESLSGSTTNIPSKPSFPKNTVSNKSDTEAQEPNKTKALANRFANTLEETNTINKPGIAHKQHTPLKSPLSQGPEAKAPIQKPPLNKPSLSSTLSDPKPVFPKPSPPVSSKPNKAKEDSGGGTPSTTGATPPKMPTLQQKPSSGVLKLRQQTEEVAGVNTDTANKPSPLLSSTSKPISNFRTAQNLFNKEDKNGQSDSGGVNKPAPAGTNSVPPPKPPTNKKPSLKKPSKPSPQTSSVNDDTTSVPKRNPLVNSLALGPPPAKPNRPPVVNLENFKRGSEASDDGHGAFKKPTIPPPPASHPSNHSNSVTPTQPPQPAVPSLPPRHPGAQQEDFYDDVDEVKSCPPPLPPTTGHPSQRAKEETDDDDGEMYEDLDERWEAAEQKQEKKKEKEEKEEKKRLEAEKKEQKEREKKEQDARKKFKLVGPLEVIQQGKARVDCKGSKTDLALKQGDCLDIIRVQGNPEGKWLGRTQDGSIGYVKTTSVEIDFNSLKNRQAPQAYEPEVYDDIDVVSSDNSGTKGPGIVLPPLPGEGGEIYDDVVDPNLEISPFDSRLSLTMSRGFLRMFERSRRLANTKVVPPPSQFTTEGKTDKPQAATDEEIYDDVDSQGFPPPPPISSLPSMKGKNKTEEMDPRKQKKFEREEKDFRKKFKYDGEIQVLYQVTVIQTLTNKKWGNKDLPVKAGETLDVIVKAVDDKLICRNEEGKFGYVSTSHIVMDDGDIYDDIGDECVYDND
ncbi:FYN-binding protein 1 isoform X2 [Mastacembelus armatus]|uniref:FYN-binding protein 1 isoform X2 n=1 Tax=Mastacembelus armatus TaxID=205130 RepID=UPI000E459A6E|nr:FYN-binding protein 1 isoform X2 [Mastacembelus armatus]